MNQQQKLERQIRTLKNEVKSLLNGNVKTTKAIAGNTQDALEALKQYISKPSIVKNFGKAEIVKVEDTRIYVRKSDNKTISCKKATLTNGTVFNVGTSRFWKA